MAWHGLPISHVGKSGEHARTEGPRRHISQLSLGAILRTLLPVATQRLVRPLPAISPFFSFAVPCGCIAAICVGPSLGASSNNDDVSAHFEGSGTAQRFADMLEDALASADDGTTPACVCLAGLFTLKVPPRPGDGQLESCGWASRTRCGHVDGGRESCPAWRHSRSWVRRTAQTAEPGKHRQTPSGLPATRQRGTASSGHAGLNDQRQPVGAVSGPRSSVHVAMRCASSASSGRVVSVVQDARNKRGTGDGSRGSSVRLMRDDVPLDSRADSYIQPTVTARRYTTQPPSVNIHLSGP